MMWMCHFLYIYLFTFTIFNILNRIDGIFFRLFFEITKHWNTKMNLLIPSSSAMWDPFKISKSNIKNGSSDTEMCSTWFTYETYQQFDFTTFIDRHCITFLVPLQQLIKEGSVIFVSLSGVVWILFIGTFVITGILSIIVAKVYFKNSRNEVRAFKFLSECYLDLVSIASSHGIQRFPKPIALKMIIIRYIIYYVCFILLSYWQSKKKATSLKLIPYRYGLMPVGCCCACY